MRKLRTDIPELQDLVAAAAADEENGAAGGGEQAGECGAGRGCYPQHVLRHVAEMSGKGVQAPSRHGAGA